MNTLKALLLLAVACTSVQATAQRNATLVLNSSTRYQHIDGFGGCGMNGQWADVYTENKVKLLWGKDGLDYNIMRIRINPDENNWGAYSNAVKWARKAEPNLQVFATPWTPPYRFKVGAEITWGQSSIHGHINVDSVESYAKWLDRYRAYMEEKGAPIDIISIQNECDYDPDYEGCLYTESEMTAMLSAANKHIDPKCKIMGPECFGWASEKYNRNLLNNASARNNIDIWGNHLYGASDLTYVKEVTRITKKPMWMTEYIFDLNDLAEMGSDEGWFNFVQSIDSCMKAGFNAYVYYNMLNNMFGDAKGGGSTNTPNRYAYAMGHYAKYATGKTRIGATLTDRGTKPLQVTAYSNDAKDTVTVCILNRSSEDVNLNIKLPFTAQQVNTIITNSLRGRYTVNSNEELGNQASPTVKVRKGAFYTYEFIKTAITEEETNTHEVLKTAEMNNPINPLQFCADPTAIEHNGRLYVFATNDQQQYDAVGGMETNTYGHIKQLQVMSTADMVNWTHHEPIDMASVCGAWLWASWAPSIVSRVEDDGLTHFYLYFSNSGGGVGVITATSPLGPWKAPLNHNLVDAGSPGLGLCNNPFDPGVVIDENGTGWLAFGGGAPNAEGTDLLPGNARIVQLGEDMISLASDIKPIPAPFHFEANELNIMGGKFVYTYCSSWRDRSTWSQYGSSLTAPSSCSMCYMTTTTPLDPDSWKFKGEYFANPGSMGYPFGNNHTHLQKFGGSYYLFYHTQWLESQQTLSGGYRSVGVNRATVLENRQTINKVTANQSGVNALQKTLTSAYEEQPGYMFNTAAGVNIVSEKDNDGARATQMPAGSWMLIKSLKFSITGASSITAKTMGEGTIEVRPGSLDAAPIATLTSTNVEGETITTDVDGMPQVIQDIYFVATRGNIKLCSWQFKESEHTGVESTCNASEIKNENYYTVEGIKTQSSARCGVTIKETTFSNGSRKISKMIKP